MKESFWGDLYGQTKLAWQRFFELQSERQRDRYSGWGRYERRRGRRRVYQRLLRAGFCDPLRHHPAAGCAYSREEFSAPWFATVSAAGGGGLAVDPGGIFARDQQAAGGAGSATLTGEVVSAQTVSKLTRDLDEAVRQFHQAQLSDDYAYLFLDGVSLRVRRPAGRKRVQMLVAYGVRRDGRRHLLAFLRSQGESQA